MVFRMHEFCTLCKCIPYDKMKQADNVLVHLKLVALKGKSKYIFILQEE